jgi:hypothetical protein
VPAFYEKSRGEVRLRVVEAAEVLGRFLDEDLDFEGRPNGAPEQMTAQRASINPTDDNMSVDLRLALVEGDIAHEREDLYLLVHGNLRIVAPVAVEVPELDATRCTYRDQAAAYEPALPREGQEPSTTSSPLSKTSAYVFSPSPPSCLFLKFGSSGLPFSTPRAHGVQRAHSTRSASPSILARL